MTDRYDGRMRTIFEAVRLIDGAAAKLAGDAQLAGVGISDPFAARSRFQSAADR